MALKAHAPWGESKKRNWGEGAFLPCPSPPATNFLSPLSPSPRATPACLKGNGKDCYAGYNQWRKLHHIASIPFLLSLLLILIMQVRSFLLLKFLIGNCQGIFWSTRNGKFYKVCKQFLPRVSKVSICMYSLCHVSSMCNLRFLFFLRAQYIALVFTKTASNWTLIWCCFIHLLPE